MPNNAPPNAAHDIEQILEGAAHLLRPRLYHERDPIETIRDAVWSCWSTQFNVPKVEYYKNEQMLTRISITIEDMRMSRRLPSNHKIPRQAVLSEDDVNRPGPGRLVYRHYRDLNPTTEYSFKWVENEDAMSVIAGDLAGGVLRWELNTLQINYEQATRTVPDKTSSILLDTIESWFQVYLFRVPEGMRLRPDIAFDHYRTLPHFMKTLDALLAFDSHKPTAVLPALGAPPESLNLHRRNRLNRTFGPDLSAQSMDLFSPGPMPGRGAAKKPSPAAEPAGAGPEGGNIPSSAPPAVAPPAVPFGQILASSGTREDLPPHGSETKPT